MYEATVRVITALDLSGKSNAEVLSIIKQTIGIYSEYDVTKLHEVLDYKKQPKREA